MVIALAAGRVAGQSVERLQARADSLLREWRRANALADMVDSLNHARTAGGTDTISVGALRIVTNPSPARLRGPRHAPGRSSTACTAPTPGSSNSAPFSSLRTT